MLFLGLLAVLTACSAQATVAGESNQIDAGSEAAAPDTATGQTDNQDQGESSDPDDSSDSTPPTPQPPTEPEVEPTPSPEIFDTLALDMHLSLIHI